MILAGLVIAVAVVAVLVGLPARMSPPEILGMATAMLVAVMAMYGLVALL